MNQAFDFSKDRQKDGKIKMIYANHGVVLYAEKVAELLMKKNHLSSGGSYCLFSEKDKFFEPDEQVNKDRIINNPIASPNTVVEVVETPVQPKPVEPAAGPDHELEKEETTKPKPPRKRSTAAKTGVGKTSIKKRNK